ncbi:two-component system sensor histidine kinase NtrB [Rossellomorea aquimaris]|uniref:two-component system sensor histidine kinase NtrB n=1 Tax=Rossellomorea aquimaris TaxID=189382 RepID=UPI0007D06A27|nr:ATP-binding protein [Rossellomorea aquimaris]
MNQHMEQMKKENEFLRTLVKDLPQSFEYRNPELGLKMNKTNESVNLTEIPKTDIGETSSRFKWGGENQLPIEVLEAFVLPILDLVPHHITFIDANGVITLCNKQAALDLQVDQNEIIGKHIRELLKIPDDDIAMIQTLKTEVSIQNKEVFDSNYGIMNTEIIRDEEGNIQRVIGTFLFLNAIKEFEKQALAGRIAAGIAHEIRNPLTTVRGFLQLLADKNIDHESLFRNLLIPEIDRANKIISDFLSIAKPTELHRELYQSDHLIKNVIGKFLKTEALLHDVTLNFHLSEDSTKLRVKVNTDELLQVFINLFQNALGAKNNDVLAIEIETKKIGSNLVISFKDNGIGISPSMQEHIFDPFFTTKSDGTGLGLSLSKKIIESHQGRIDVKSSKEGTTFMIELPFEE